MQNVKEWESNLHAVMALTLNNDYLSLPASLQILGLYPPKKFRTYLWFLLVINTVLFYQVSELCFSLCKIWN